MLFRFYINLIFINFFNKNLHSFTKHWERLVVAQAFVTHKKDALHFFAGRLYLMSLFIFLYLLVNHAEV